MFISEAKQLAQRFNGLNRNLGSQFNALQGQHVAMVSEINGLSGNIAESNAQIREMESARCDAATLRDYRDNLLKDLSQSAGIRVQETLMPSDDPISAARVLRTQREEATLTQSNIFQGVGQPVQAGSQPQGGDDTTMLNVHDLPLWAANGTGYAAVSQSVVAQATLSRFAVVSLLS